MEVDRDQVLRKLVDIQYQRNDFDFHRGTFRVRGDVVEIFPAYEEEHAIRVEFFGDEIEQLALVDPLRGKRLGAMRKRALPPASHYVTPKEVLDRAIGTIQEELRERLRGAAGDQDKLLEAQRLEQRTLFDLEMLEEMGFCTGIENYSRHLTGRAPGEPPPTLLDYFPEDFLLVIDESHVTMPQVGGMYRGDRSRKETLVEYGFRLPSALDNRPLRFDEFEAPGQPGDLRLRHARRATSWRRPGARWWSRSSGPPAWWTREMEVRPATGQVDDLLEEIRVRGGRRGAGAGHHPDQAHGRGPHRVLRGAGGHGRATCTPTSTPWSG